MSKVIIGWPDLWSMVKEMPIEGLRAVGQELNGDDFTHWIKSRSPKVQEEILEAAPETIQQYFYSKNVIASFVVARLGIQPSNRIKRIDNRR